MLGGCLPWCEKKDSQHKHVYPWIPNRSKVTLERRTSSNPSSLSHGQNETERGYARPDGSCRYQRVPTAQPSTNPGGSREVRWLPVWRLVWHPVRHLVWHLSGLASLASGLASWLDV